MHAYVSLPEEIVARLFIKRAEDHEDDEDMKMQSRHQGRLSRIAYLQRWIPEVQHYSISFILPFMYSKSTNYNYVPTYKYLYALFSYTILH